MTDDRRLVARKAQSLVAEALTAPLMVTTLVSTVMLNETGRVCW